MVRTPEQYFQDQNFDAPELAINTQLTSAEQAFLQKYVGIDDAKALGIDFDEALEIPHSSPIPDISLEEELKLQKQLQLIFFHITEHDYTIPIEAVREVIKFTQPMHLPLTPDFIAGVINLRGRVTPLVYMDKLLECSMARKAENSSLHDKFIIICQAKGMQFGLIIDKVQTMCIIKQQDISWNVETQLGASVACICGIVEHGNKIFGIISIDKIVNLVLQSRGTL